MYSQKVFQRNVRTCRIPEFILKVEFAENVYVSPYDVSFSFE